MTSPTLIVALSVLSARSRMQCLLLSECTSVGLVASTARMPKFRRLLQQVDAPDADDCMQELCAFLFSGFGTFVASALLVTVIGSVVLLWSTSKID